MTVLFFFFFNDTATTEIYTLSLHDSLPIFIWQPGQPRLAGRRGVQRNGARQPVEDRKSTRLNSSHVRISYAGFSLKKKKNNRFISIKIINSNFQIQSIITTTH